MRSEILGNGARPDDVPCFAPGTLIDTPQGPRPVERLRPGDHVLTRDNGAQEILWTSARRQRLGLLAPDARPVEIAAGALGAGERAMVVSPRHRMLVGGGGQLQGLFRGERLIPARALAGLPGVRFLPEREEITWIHFACKHHEVVRAEGRWTESLLIGPRVLRGLDAPARLALYKLFPGPNLAHASAAAVGRAPEGWALNGAPARRLLRAPALHRALAAHEAAELPAAA